MTSREKEKKRPFRSAQKKTPPVQENTFTIDSLSALADYALHKPSAILSIQCNAKQKKKIAELCPVFLDRIELADNITPEREEIGLSAQVTIVPLEESDLKAKIKSRDKDLLLVLDHITDPRNLGAIARSCAFFGVEDLVIAKNRQVSLTDASVATSQGAFALTRLVKVTNIVRTLEHLKSEGYWIIGCEKGGQDLETIHDRYEKVALVLGSEDKGLSPLVRKTCDLFAGISGAKLSLDSLNVSVASGILLRAFHFGQKNKIKKKNS